MTPSLSKSLDVEAEGTGRNSFMKFSTEVTINFRNPHKMDLSPRVSLLAWIL